MDATSDGGAPPVGQVGASDPLAQRTFEEQAYRRGVEGAGYDFDKVGGGDLRNRFDPIRNLFRFNATFDRGAGRDAPNNFEAFSQANTGGGSNIYTQARNLFNRVAGGREKMLGFEDRDLNKDIFRGVGRTWNPATREFTNDDPENIRGHLMQLARTAAFDKYGGWGFGGAPDESASDEFDRAAFAQRSAAERGGPQAAGVDWTAILRRRFGL